MGRYLTPYSLRARHVVAVAFLVATVLFVRTTCADPFAFVEGIEDLPLMPHLRQGADDPTVFDTPYGSIVESSASGQVSNRDILDFYLNTLPQLGWSPQSETSFQRDSEHLTLNITRSNASAYVLFRISRSP